MIYQPTVTLPPRGYGMRDLLRQVMRVRINTWRENLNRLSTPLAPSPYLSSPPFPSPTITASSSQEMDTADLTGQSTSPPPLLLCDCAGVGSGGQSSSLLRLHPSYYRVVLVCRTELTDWITARGQRRQ
ncbi:unnamed protein product [Arctogadus glacialis]